MRMLFLTVLTLFSLEAFAGAFLYRDKNGLSITNPDIVKEVQLRYLVAGFAQITVRSRDGKVCSFYNTEQNRNSETLKMYQTLLETLKNHNVKDGLRTILDCEKRGDLTYEIQLTTDRAQ